MKVAHIAVYPRQGRTHSTQEDLSALAGYLKALLANVPQAQRGGHCILTNLKASGRRLFTDDGIDVEECWQKGSPFFCFQILNALRRRPQTRIVHLQHEFNQFGGAITLPFILFMVWAARFLLGRSMLITIHEVLEKPRITREFLKNSCIAAPVWAVKLFLRVYYGLLCWLAHAVIVQDEAFAETMTRDYGVKAGKLHIVRIGTAEGLALPQKTAVRERFNLSPDCPTLLFFGTIDRRKGIDLLLEALKLMGREAPALLVAGGLPVRVRETPEYKAWLGPLRAMMEAMPEVRFLGFVEDELVPSLYAACDLVVLPYTEPQRVSAVFSQCASYEMPFLVSPVFADQSEEAQLFEPTPRALAAKIQWALKDENQERLRQASRRFKAANSWQASWRTLYALYCGLASAGQKPGSRPLA
jgi:glycosyltransferase involved in cell wall biosynthesis